MRNLVVARLTEVAAKSEFIPMRTLITKAGGTAALRKMSHSKAANALKNAAKELQQERKAKGLGYKIDKAKAQEWLDTNAPKRTRGAEGTSKRPASKKTLSVDKMDAGEVFDTVRPNDVKKIARSRSNKDKMIDNAAHDAVINTIIKEGKGDLLDNGGYEKLSKSPKFKALVEKVKNLIKEKVSSLTPAQKAKGTKPNPKPRGSSSESNKEGRKTSGSQKDYSDAYPLSGSEEELFDDVTEDINFRDLDSSSGFEYTKERVLHRMLSNMGWKGRQEKEGGKWVVNFYDKEGDPIPRRIKDDLDNSLGRHLSEIRDTKSKRSSGSSSSRSSRGSGGGGGGRRAGGTGGGGGKNRSTRGGW